MEKKFLENDFDILSSFLRNIVRDKKLLYGIESEIGRDGIKELINLSDQLIEKTEKLKHSISEYRLNKFIFKTSGE